jgi:hypothetical protein
VILLCIHDILIFLIHHIELEYEYRHITQAKSP